MHTHPARRSRSGIRHDDGPISEEHASRTARERDALMEGLCKAGTAIALLLMGCHILGVGL